VTAPVSDALWRTWLRVRSRVLRALLRWVLPIRSRRDLVRLGSRYGGWVVPEAMLVPGAVCYCAGLGEDGSFDLELAVRYRCRVFVFDPTPRSIEYASRKLAGVSRLQFKPVGLWSEARTMRFYAPRDTDHVSHSVMNLQRTADWFEAPCLGLRDLMTEWGHHRIDVLKLDIEGAEYAVLV
jgi:FkbM family methyltransferase